MYEIEVEDEGDVEAASHHLCTPEEEHRLLSDMLILWKRHCQLLRWTLLVGLSKL